MARYVKRPKMGGWVEDDYYSSEESSAPLPTVSDHEAIYTGLLDCDGDEIWREPNLMGFHGIEGSSF